MAVTAYPIFLIPTYYFKEMKLSTSNIQGIHYSYWYKKLISRDINKDTIWCIKIRQFKPFFMSQCRILVLGWLVDAK